MPNVTTKEAYNRRQAIWKDWVKGIRSITELAERHKTTYHTVLRDLNFLKRNSRMRNPEKALEFIRQEEDSALLEDIIQIEDLIKEMRTTKTEKTKAIVESGQVVGCTTEKSSIDYYAIIGLIDRKIKIRRQRQELWGLVSSQKGGVNVEVKAHASANANTSITREDRTLQDKLLSQLGRYFQN